MTTSPTLFPSPDAAAARPPHLHVAGKTADPVVPLAPATPFATDEHFFFGERRIAPAHPTTPGPDELAGYVFDPALTLVAKAFVRSEPLFFIGPTGCGKTSFARYLAYQLGWPYYEIPHDAQIELEDLFGKATQLDDGRWVFADGPVVRAYESGGILVADEAPAVKPAVLQAYHPILSRSPLLVRTDAGVRTVKAHPTFRWIGTGNPWGTYAGNYEPGFALIDRCIIHEFDYLPSEQEIAVLVGDGPDVPLGVIKDLVAFANIVRAGAKANPDTCRYTVSTRALRKLMRMMHQLDATLEEAVENSIRTPLRIMFPDEIAAVDAILTAHVPLDSK